MVDSTSARVISIRILCSICTVGVYLHCWGTRRHSWLRHCTSREVAGSIPDCVIGIFHWHNPSDRAMTLELTQPLTEMSTRNISGGERQPVRRADNLNNFMCRLSWNLGASNSWNPQGLSRTGTGFLWLICTVSSGLLLWQQKYVKLALLLAYQAMSVLISYARLCSHEKHLFTSSCPSVRPCVLIIAALIGRITLRLIPESVMKICRESRNLVKNGQKYRAFHMVILMQATINRHTSAHFEWNGVRLLG